MTRAFDGVHFRKDVSLQARWSWRRGDVDWLLLYAGVTYKGEVPTFPHTLKKNQFGEYLAAPRGTLSASDFETSRAG